MKIIKTVADMQATSETVRLNGKRIAVVPTMGALHEGHLSLVKLAKASADVVIMTIFVNPLQFGPSEDLAKYPRPFERDAALAQAEGVDYLFNPSPDEIYGKNFQTYVSVESVSQELEGAIRPGHFRGVSTVVTKFFNITKPHCAVFGEKDAQQLAVIKRMVRDLNADIEIIPAPIVRESDGLALSSRNIYLNPEERQQATVLYKAIQLASQKIKSGARSSEGLVSHLSSYIVETSPLAKIDYIAVVDAETFEPIKKLEREKEYLLLLTVKFGQTRLLDNWRFTL
ncbi:MAG: pantoate--beta-alanine ligase [Chlorobiales bacterium]|nr:pantoate--beta-alanine ligase [Chlorobiales bacterium]